jgi:beta-lactamase class C
MIRIVILVVFIVGGSLLFFTNSKKTEAAINKTAPDSLPAKAEERIEIVKLNDPRWDELLTNYEDFIQQSIDNRLAPGAAVVIVKDSSIVYMKGFGYRHAGTKEPVDANTIFRLGSVSKCFASVLSGMLVQENIFRWDDPVINYVPHFALKTKEQTQGISLRHILSHTTGLPYHAFTNLVEEGNSLDTMVYHLRELDLLGKPGQLYSYQNVAYSVIGQVIQAATGKTYEAMMQEKIFAPLHMTRASLNFDAIKTEKNMAMPHRHSASGWAATKLSSTYYNVGPAGGINASISDMGLFLTSLTRDNHPLLDSTTQDQIFHPFVRASAKNRHFYSWKRPTSAYYGMGWRIINFKDDVVYYHGGYVNGFRSEIAIHPKDNIAICVLVNSTGPLADQSIPEFFRKYDQYLPVSGKPLQGPRPPAP